MPAQNGCHLLVLLQDESGSRTMKGIHAQLNSLMDFDNSRETPTVFFITAATYFTVNSKQI